MYFKEFFIAHKLMSIAEVEERDNRMLFKHFIMPL